MPAPLTLIIPTHNRHSYLRRAIDYYKDFEYPILILDSSTEVFDLITNAQVKYLHLPEMQLPEKLYTGFCIVETEFVVMCADDDFLITQGLNECLNYLQKNTDYAVADGAYLFYKKHDIFKNKINFNLLYKSGLDAHFASENVLKRLDDFFKNYRTVFYGVHRTKNLRYTFEHCRQSYTNLYLNEYLTALLPVAMGYCRFIPKLMGVREASPESGDKTTINLDMMFTNNIANKELENYISSISGAINKKTGLMEEQILQSITNVLFRFSQSIRHVKQIDQLSNKTLTKKAGYFLSKVPYVGTWLIKQRRAKISYREIGNIVLSDNNKKSLQTVEDTILQFQSAC